MAKDESLVEEIEDFIFEPKPGGMVDTWRKREAAKKAAEAEQQNINERVEERAYKAVKTTLESPEVFSAQTFNIQPGTSAMVLPGSPYRYRAVIKFVSSGSAQANATVAKDASAALGGNGFLLTYGESIVTHTRGQVYVFNNDTAVAQISVLAEIYAPEK